MVGWGRGTQSMGRAGAVGAVGGHRPRPENGGKVGVRGTGSGLGRALNPKP